jgi:hypothetical protein
VPSAGVVLALEKPALLVFLNTIQVTRTPHVFFFAPCSPDDRIAMALLSAARPASPPIPEEDRRTSRGGGRAARPAASQISLTRLELPKMAVFVTNLPQRFFAKLFTSTRRPT